MCFVFKSLVITSIYSKQLVSFYFHFHLFSVKSKISMKNQFNLPKVSKCLTKYDDEENAIFWRYTIFRVVTDAFADLKLPFLLLGLIL
jgi:hypothetical protein